MCWSWSLGSIFQVELGGLGCCRVWAAAIGDDAVGLKPSFLCSFPSPFEEFKATWYEDIPFFVYNDAKINYADWLQITQ